MKRKQLFEDYGIWIIIAIYYAIIMLATLIGNKMNSMDGQIYGFIVGTLVSGVGSLVVLLVLTIIKYNGILLLTKSITHHLKGKIKYKKNVKISKNYEIPKCMKEHLKEYAVGGKRYD